MIRRLLPLATLLLIRLPAAAAQPAAETPPATPETPAAAGGDVSAPTPSQGLAAEPAGGKDPAPGGADEEDGAASDALIRVIVPQLEAQGVAEALALNLSGVVLLRLQEVPDTSVVGHADIERLLGQEQQRQLAGCGDDATCASGIVGALDAARLVWGSVGKVGDRFLVNLTLLDTQTNAVLRRTSRKAVSVDNLVEAASSAADALWLTPNAPADGCVDCGAKPTSLQVALKLGNNFMSFFQSGVDVSLFGPGLDIDVGYRFADRFAGFLTVGLSLGNRQNDADDDVRFLVIPLNLGVRYHSTKLVADLAAFGGLSLGVGFVNTAISGGDENLGPSFAAKIHAGVSYGLVGNLGALLEASYQLTTTTPDDLATRPLSAAALKLGLAYGF